MRSGLVADKNEIKWNKNNKKSFYMFYISVSADADADADVLLLLLLLLFRPAVGISGNRAKCNAATPQSTTYISFYFILFWKMVHASDGPAFGSARVG